jgi:hypothetical protein
VIARVKLRTFAGATTIFCNSNPQSIVSPDEPAAINSRDHSATEEAILRSTATFAAASITAANVRKLRREDSECDRAGTCAEFVVSPTNATRPQRL